MMSYKKSSFSSFLPSSFFALTSSSVNTSAFSLSYAARWLIFFTR